MSTCPPELKRLYREGRVIPFIGAGASMSVEWKNGSESRRGPSWSQMVDKAAELIGASDPDLLRIRGSDLQILEYLRIKQNTMFPLIHWLQSNMQPGDFELRASKIHSALAGLELCRKFYTTNYDNFIERALAFGGRPNTAISSEHDLSQQVASTQVVKFHGDFNRPETMVLSESDYEKRMRLESPMDYKLRSDVLGNALLFVGYSFRDANIAYLFRLINDHFGNLPQSFVGSRAYIIYYNPSDFERQLFRARSIDVIPILSADRATGVADVLNSMAS